MGGDDGGMRNDVFAHRVDDFRADDRQTEMVDQHRVDDDRHAGMLAQVAGDGQRERTDGQSPILIAAGDIQSGERGDLLADDRLCREGRCDDRIGARLWRQDAGDYQRAVETARGVGLDVGDAVGPTARFGAGETETDG